ATGFQRKVGARNGNDITCCAAFACRGLSAEAEGIELRWRGHPGWTDHAEANVAARGPSGPVWLGRGAAYRVAELDHSQRARRLCGIDKEGAGENGIALAAVELAQRYHRVHRKFILQICVVEHEGTRA